jgi:hypothetical protein
MSGPEPLADLARGRTTSAPPPPPPLPQPHSVAYWVAYGFFLVVGISALGALLGAVFFVVIGGLAQARLDWAERALLGVRTIGFWFFIWSVGVALIVCVIRAKGERDRWRAR